MLTLIVDIENTIDYLLNNNLIDVDSIVNDHIKVADVSKKNRNVVLYRKEQTSYLLKQSFSGSRKRSGIVTEHNLYSLVHNYSEFSEISSLFPRSFRFDTENQVLITEYLNNMQSIYNNFRQINYNDFSKSAFMIGKSLAACHSLFRNHINDHRLDFLPKAFPTTIVAFRPNPWIYVNITKANLEILKIVQNHKAFLNSLEELYMEWQNSNLKTVVHGDMKLDNIITNHGSSEAGIKIIDWELSRIGDPAWDVAGIFHDFISYWVNLLPLSKTTNIEELIYNTYRPLQNIKRAFRAFWLGYIMTVGDKESPKMLQNCTKYCAARLIQKVYESHQYSDRLLPRAFFILQVSLNIIQNPEETIIHLFGIPGAK